MRILALLALLAALTGCYTVAKTAVDVVTLPVKAVSAGVDAVTTTQSEADEDRGRAMRKAEEAHGKALREWERDCSRRTRRGEPCPPRPAFVSPDSRR
ncbi:hypothetical protein [Sphingomonas edaphi]|uniref:Lipoprotein n=1 Tax=Sphingomonas edaphi TaxID=2315689 RepID=A0A418Q0S7_9SPHN|nr:hypothetical protein [Sphingomonas edaphi]RIX29443.1 hypothetical protein D3M59_06980 [Sphingomonas edaphi]